MIPCYLLLACSLFGTQTAPKTNPEFFTGTFATHYLSQRTVTISLAGQQLQIQMNQGRKAALVEQDHHLFLIEGYPLTVRFAAELNQPAQGFTLIQNQRETSFYALDKLQSQYQAIATDLRPHGLSEAVLMNDLAAAKQLIDKGADVMELDTRPSIAGPNGRRPLNWAALQNNVAMIELLLTAGADIHGTNRSGYTALHHAAEAGALEAARFLLEKGADKTLKNANQQTPVEVAARLDHRDLVPVLDIN